jgi:hypothetical protein
MLARQDYFSEQGIVGFLKVNCIKQMEISCFTGQKGTKKWNSQLGFLQNIQIWEKSPK